MKIRAPFAFLTVFSIVIFALLILLKSGLERHPRVKEIETPTAGYHRRAISLNVLFQNLIAARNKGTFSRELLGLAGITKILGYIIDNTNNDLILFGSVDAALPPLNLEDFVVALRNTWMKYATLEGQTYHYSDPGCSIDPNPRVIKYLGILGNQIHSSADSEGVERCIEKWHEVSSSAQDVRVLGLPFESHFAWVMVKADYDMKRLVDGSDSLNILGFSSLSDLTLEEAKKDVLKGNPISIPLSSMNRFWFYPGRNLYQEDEEIVLIKECQVILLTEEEHLDKSEKIVGKGRPDKLAKRFADGFSTHYNEVAKERPIYIELENVFRFVALAKILKIKISSEDMPKGLEYLLEDAPITNVPVSRQLPGRSNVKRAAYEQNVPGGNRIMQLWLPSSGGVSIDIEVSGNNFIRGEKEELSDLKHTVLTSKPSAVSLSWDIPD